FEPDDQRQVKVCFFHCRDDPGRNDVALHDAAENIHQNPLNIAVAENDLERGSDLFLAGAAAHIQEICRDSTVMLDNVHRSHGQPGAVHEAGDVSVELDIIE